MDDDLERVMALAEQYEKDDEHHNDGYYSASELRTLYREILRLRKEVSSQPSAWKGGREIDLSNEIMNIKVTSSKIGKAIEESMLYDKDLESRLALAYKLGHKDARHAAAQLVCSTQPTEREER